MEEIDGNGAEMRLKALSGINFEIFESVHVGRVQDQGADRDCKCALEEANKRYYRVALINRVLHCCQHILKMTDKNTSLTRLDVLTRHLTSAVQVSGGASSSDLPNAADLEKFLVRDNAELRNRIYEFLKVPALSTHI